MEEIWREIHGYKGKYFISNLGRVKSLKRSNGYIMKATYDKDGYMTIGLSYNGVRKTHKIHRLVANMFIPNPNDFKEINHKDEDKSNNTINNLEWCDRKYNVNYGTAIQRGSDKCCKRIKGINTKDNSTIFFNSSVDAERNGFSATSICHCIANRIRTHKGYKWYYRGDDVEKH